MSLQPAAGAHGELTGMLMTRAFHRSRGDGDQRTIVIVPDSAHGTNPATASMVGYTTRTVPSNARGGIDLEALRAALGPDTAALMLTNPSTLGIFEDQIDEVLAAVREAGAIAYMDGANLNAILGRFRAGEAGFDIMHFNLHKTFSTPHGGGGPGAGPIGVSERMAPFLPEPLPLLVAGDPGHRAAPTPGPDGRRRMLASSWRRRAHARRPSARSAPSVATSGCTSGRTPTSGPTAARACAR